MDTESAPKAAIYARWDCGIVYIMLSVQVGAQIIDPCHLILMEFVQSFLCFRLFLSSDDKRPAGVIIMNRRHLYVTSCGFDVETKSESNQNRLDS